LLTAQTYRGKPVQKLIKHDMTPDTLSALLLFAVIGAFTPGPNNTLLMASGITYGFWRTLPLMLGVATGFPLMLLIIGSGLGQIFEMFPVLYTVLKYLGAAYMLWLAWKIATTKPAGGEAEAEGKPMSFLQAAAFQWGNPKGWIMGLTALSTYTVAANYSLGVAIVALVFLVAGIGSSTTWALFGASLRRFLTDPRYFRAINIALGGLLVLSLWPLLH
jgi:threonine/homoserine/homoserine lactone efflux protein